MKFVSICRLLFICCCIQITFTGCKNPPVEKNNEVAAQDADTGGSLDYQTFRTAIKDLPAGELLDSNSLKKYLPENLMSLKRISLISRRTDYAGSPMAITDVTYKTAANTIYLTLTDVGSNVSYMKSLAPWSQMQFENRTNDGYEKSYLRWGNKTNEKYNSISQTASISVIYDDRILVTLEGIHLKVEDLQKVIQ